MSLATPPAPFVPAQRPAPPPAAVRRPRYDVRKVTLRAEHEGLLPSVHEFRENQWRFLVGKLDPNPDADATICVWDIHSDRWLLPPEYLEQYRRRTEGDRRRLLVVNYRYSDAVQERIEEAWMNAEEAEIDEPRVEDLAWRLERHWITEWEDRAVGIPRPPVLLRTGPSAALIGADLPPRLRATQAALLVFPLVTADELRETYRALGLEPPISADLSRALTYYESVGVVHEAPPDVAAHYRDRRGIGSRPLRVFVSLPRQPLTPPEWWCPDSLATPILATWTPLEEVMRDPAWLPVDGDVGWRFCGWHAFVQALRARGLRSV